MGEDPRRDLRGARRLIAVDTNLLVYAHRVDSQWHEGAASRLRELAEGGAPWAVPWPCMHEFFAVVTHPRIFKPPTPLETALETVDEWCASPRLHLLSERGDYWPGLRAVLEAGRITGGRVHDARIAALCLSHGVRELWTVDRDFSRFPELATRNPLAEARP